MIEVAAPAPGSRFITTIGDVRRHGVQTGTWPLPDEVHNHGGANETAYLVADANPAVLNDDVDFSDMAGILGQQTAKHRQQRPQVFVYRVGVQPVRDHDLNLRLARWIDRSNQPRVFG